MKLTRLYRDFFESEKAGGLILVFVTAISLLLANTAWQTDYIHFWHLEFAGQSTVHWINDGLMTIFFLLIGLELKREISSFAMKLVSLTVSWVYSLESISSNFLSKILSSFIALVN